MGNVPPQPPQEQAPPSLRQRLLIKMAQFIDSNPLALPDHLRPPPSTYATGGPSAAPTFVDARIQCEHELTRIHMAIRKTEQTMVEVQTDIQTRRNNWRGRYPKYPPQKIDSLMMSDPAMKSLLYNYAREKNFLERYRARELALMKEQTRLRTAEEDQHILVVGHQQADMNKQLVKHLRKHDFQNTTFIDEQAEEFQQLASEIHHAATDAQTQFDAPDDDALETVNDASSVLRMFWAPDERAQPQPPLRVQPPMLRVQQPIPQRPILLPPVASSEQLAPRRRQNGSAGASLPMVPADAL